MKNKRRHFFIDKSFQARYAIYTALTLLVVCGVSLAGLYFGIWGSVIESFSDEKLLQNIQLAARIQDYEYYREPLPADTKQDSLRLFKEVDLLSARQREILDDILRRANTRLIQQAGFLILLIAIGSIYLTHKIAGPMYRFRKSFEAVERGDLTTRIFLRKRDEAMSVANAFNHMIRTLDQSLSRLKQMARESDPQELKPKIDTELSRFKTTDF